MAAGINDAPGWGGGWDNYVASFPSPQSTLLSRIRGVFVVCGVAGFNAALWGRINFILIGVISINMRSVEAGRTAEV